MRLNYIFSLAVLLTMILISGCVNPGSSGTLPDGVSKSITTKISPAGDLSGDWQGLPGSAKWHDNVANWACSYEGYFHLSLKQNGNALTGILTTTITKVMPNSWNTDKVPCSTPGEQSPAQLTGTISSSSYKFVMANLIDFSGAYTSETIQGSFESCPNQKCLDGMTATGTIGDFKASRQH